MLKWLQRRANLGDIGNRSNNQYNAAESYAADGSTIEQVNDDANLLELMITDQEQAAPIYHSAARWKKYSVDLVDFIKANGLADFRRIQDRDDEGAKGLRSFAAIDLLPDVPKFDPEKLFKATNAATVGKSAKSIMNLSNSRVGNPEGFERDGNFYCLNWLNSYFRYAFVSRFMDFDKQVIVEIGPGSGKQAEMLKKAHPGLTILLFDIPPQLYVCNQYLEKVFEGSDQVTGYEKTRKFTSFSDIEIGKINILPNWQIGLLEKQKIDLLWNAASFQEMTPGIVKHYMDKCQGAQSLYLQYAFKQITNETGSVASAGVITPEYLGDFSERGLETATLPYKRKNWAYSDSFWCGSDGGNDLPAIIDPVDNERKAEEHLSDGSIIEQVNDDASLLELMITDQEQAAPIYHSAARWKKYSAHLIRFIKANGLTDFRRIKDRDDEGAKGLRSFAAVDFLPTTPSFDPEVLIKATRAAAVGTSAKSIANLSNSRVGNPEGFERDDNFYSLSWLNFYFRYAFVSRFMDFDKQVIVEIGSGSGKQTEMLKKAHPGLTILLFDIPPQLYVCNQYLEKVFEGSDQVTGYEKTRKFTSFSDIEIGKINILPNWQIGLLENQKFDLLWNAASFQEIMPEIVKHYMDMCQGAQSLYLQYQFNQTHAETGELASPQGVITSEYLGNFVEKGIEVAALPYVRKNWPYYDSFWCASDGEVTLPAATTLTDNARLETLERRVADILSLLEEKGIVREK